MDKKRHSLTSKEILDIYFLENRARLLEIAALLDRIDRAPDAADKEMDFRYRAFVEGIRLLLDTDGERTKAVQLSFSDPSSEPIDGAVGLKAVGAWEGGRS
jgi:hypothetical protein